MISFVAEKFGRMSDIIQLLPDSVANQIAAGEVIQRPASVVKELMENAIDAESDTITVNIKDAGKTLIQIIDDGKGMSETDARMAFERHATSKISNANDLFAIGTMGFRGEALASIAAVADVELRTKIPENELGTYIHIKGTAIQKQEPVSCSPGANFSIKNLFFNIPARRKFLKKNVTEFNYIKNEFQKVALAYPEIGFSLIHNDNTVYKLRGGSLRQRIIEIFGKNINQYLVPVNSETSILKIYGFIGKPEIARRSKKEQFFYVNNRFMKHPYFYKAVLSAYEQIIDPSTLPVFFLYFEISPDKIDINIHPAKTEINFEDSRGIFQILRATVREALGKFNVVPSIDFDREGEIEMPYINENAEYNAPEVSYDPTYNPFEQNSNTYSNKSTNKNYKDNIDNWEKLYEGFENENMQENSFPEQKTIDDNEETGFVKVFQMKNKYIVTPVKSGLMIINPKRAHERILFERFMSMSRTDSISSQKVLYPQIIELNLNDLELISQVLDDLGQIGFEITISNDENLQITGIPAHLTDLNQKDLIERILINLKDDGQNIIDNAKERLSEITAKAASVNYGRKFTSEEMKNVIDNLFACQMPNFTPSGRTIISIIKYEDIEKLF